MGIGWVRGALAPGRQHAQSVGQRLLRRGTTHHLRPAPSLPLRPVGPQATLKSTGSRRWQCRWARCATAWRWCPRSPLCLAVRLAARLPLHAPAATWDGAGDGRAAPLAGGASSAYTSPLWRAPPPLSRHRAIQPRPPRQPAGRTAVGGAQHGVSRAGGCAALIDGRPSGRAALAAAAPAGRCARRRKRL